MLFPFDFRYNQPISQRKKPPGRASALPGKETRNTYSGTSTTPTTVTVVSYTVDYAGNLRTVETAVNNVDAGTVSYTYGDSRWADLLTAYDGHAIAYEGQTFNPATGTVTGTVATGNPINWYNGTSYTGLNWTQGRRLESITKGSDTYSYEYDMSGVRCVKIADGLRHEYVTQNGKVVRETVTNASTGAFQYMLDFTYDESGHPLTMRRYYNEAQTSYNTYHYVLNAQGDVIKLLHGANTTVAEYSYDAWGRILTAAGSLADVNPLRYRGYYYDAESGFYYLQSRYYDPALGRFLNADSYASTGQGFLGYNVFAYCENNSVNFNDPTGALLFPGEIHNEVVRQYAELFSLLSEKIVIYRVDDEIRYGGKTYKYKRGEYGRADLVARDGQVWEVKPNNSKQIKRGIEQIEKYTAEDSMLVSNPELNLTYGEELPPLEFFYHSGLSTYYVTARYAGYGIITYDYEQVDFDWQKVEAGVATIFYIAAFIATAGVAGAMMPPPLFS